MRHRAAIFHDESWPNPWRVIVEVKHVFSKWTVHEIFQFPTEDQAMVAHLDIVGCYRDPEFKRISDWVYLDPVDRGQGNG